MPTVSQLKRRLKKEADTTTGTYKTKTKDIKGETTPLKLKFEVWDDPHPVLQLKESDVGQRIWLAGNPSTWETELTEYHNPGEDPRFPDGGLEVKVRDMRADRGHSSYRDVFFEEAILHPSVLTEARLEEYFEVRDLRRKNG